MRQIIYASNVTDEIVAPETLNTIVAQANKNNPRDKITGLLLYGDNLFFQVLEGPDEMIQDMKDRIWADPRHQGITELKNSAIEDRNFPDWSMGCFEMKGKYEQDGTWAIVDLDSIADHMPPTISPDVLVLARTFFQSIARHKII